MFANGVVNLAPLRAASVSKIFVTHEATFDGGVPYRIIGLLEIEPPPNTARLISQRLNVHRVARHAFSAIVFNDVFELLIGQVSYNYRSLHTFYPRRLPLILPPLGRASPPPQLWGPMSASVGLRGRVEGRLAARPKGRSPAYDPAVASMSIWRAIGSSPMASATDCRRLISSRMRAASSNSRLPAACLIRFSSSAIVACRLWPMAGASARPMSTVTWSAS